MRRLAPLLGLLTAGCVIDDVDVSGRDCLEGACPQGFVCDLSGGPPGRCFAGGGRRDSGGRDAGPSARPDAGPRRDAGSFDGGGDAGVLNDCGDAGDAHLFCENFDDGALDPRWLPRLAGGSTVEVTNEAARSGRFSARATSNPLPDPDPGGFTGMIYVEAFEGMSVTDRWARARFLFRAGTGTETSILDMGNALFEQGVIVDVGGLDSVGWFSSFDGGDVFDASVALPRDLEEDTWFCLELHVVTGETDGRIELFVDGTMVSSRVGVDTRAADTFQNVAFGSWHFAPSGVRIVFVDDVIVSTVRPGC